MSDEEETQVFFSNAPTPMEQMIKLFNPPLAADRVARITELVEQYPELAQTDPAILSPSGERNPFIFSAVSYASPPLVKLFLDHGATPGTTDKDGNTVLERVLRQHYSPNTAAILSMMLDHRECRLAKENRSAKLPIEQLGSFLSSPETPLAEDEELQRRKLVTRMINQTPTKAFGPKREVLESILHIKGQVGEDNAVFFIRALVNRGVDLNIGYGAISHMLRRDQNKALAAFLATGIEENRGFYGENGLAVHLDHISQKKTFKGWLDDYSLTHPDPRIEARRMLNEEVSHYLNGQVTLRDLLFTPEGRPTWQAQGLAHYRMLNELFDNKQQTNQPQGERAAVVAEMMKKLPARFGLDEVSFLRNVALSRPHDSVTVEYMHGQTSPVSEVTV